MKKSLLLTLSSLLITTSLLSTAAFAQTTSKDDLVNMNKQQVEQYVKNMKQQHPQQANIDVKTSSTGGAQTDGTTSPTSLGAEIWNGDWGGYTSNMVATIDATVTNRTTLYAYFSAKAGSGWYATGSHSMQAQLGVTAYGISPTVSLNGNLSSGISSASNVVASGNTTGTSTTMNSDNIRTGWLNLIKADFIGTNYATVSGSGYSISTYATFWGVAN